MNSDEKLLQSYKRALERDFKMIKIGETRVLCPIPKKTEKYDDIFKGWIKINEMISKRAEESVEFIEKFDLMMGKMQREMEKQRV